MPFIVKKLVVAPMAPWKPVSDRRHEVRDHALAEQPLSARLMGGIDVKLRNISPRGVLFESPVRMQVSERVTLRLRTASDSLVLPGEVVRCRVSATRHGRLRYETALALSTEYMQKGHAAGVFSAPQGEPMAIVDEAVDSVTLSDGT